MKLFGIHVVRKTYEEELREAAERIVMLEAEIKSLEKDSLQWRTEEDEKLFKELYDKIDGCRNTIKTSRKQLCEVNSLLDAEKEYSNRLYKMLRGFRVSDIGR